MYEITDAWLQLEDGVAGKSCLKSDNGIQLDKNSSGDEIANVNCFYDDIAHVLQNTKKVNLLRLTN